MGLGPCCLRLTNDKIANALLNLRPIFPRKHTISGIPLVGGPRPVFGSLHQTMLDRIVVDVVDVSLEVGFIPDLVLPEASLPNPSLSLFHPRLGLGQLLATLSRKPMGEASLDT
jgi:hypothetical protein